MSERDKIDTKKEMFRSITELSWGHSVRVRTRRLFSMQTALRAYLKLIEGDEDCEDECAEVRQDLEYLSLVDEAIDAYRREKIHNGQYD